MPVGEFLPASTSCKTAPGDGFAALTPDRVVAAFADAAAPVEGFTALDNVVEENAASATVGVAAAFVESALLRWRRNLFLQVLLIVTYVEDNLCALYWWTTNIWSIFIELLGSACQSASLLFQRSCSGLYTANSF